MASTIKGITVSLGGETTKLNKALKDSETTSRNLQKELNLVNKELKFNPDNAVLLSQKTDILKDKISATREKLEKLNEVQGQIEKQAKSGDLGADEYRAYQREVETTKSKLSHLETELKNTGDKFNEVQRKSGNVDFKNAENKVDHLKGKFKDFSEDAVKKMDVVSEKAKKIGDGLGKVSTPLNVVSGASAAGIGAAIKLASDFEDAMAKVSTIADTSNKPLEELRAEIIKLSNQTGVDSVTIAENVYDAISAGQDTANAVNFVANSIKLQKAGFADAAQSIDLLTTILNAYGLEAKDATHVSDVLIQTQNLGKTTVAQLAESMGNVIPTANSYGVTLEQLAAAYAITTAKGINTANSTTYINSMLNELGKSGTKVSKALKEETGKSFKELMDSGYSLGDVLQIVKDNADKNNVSFNDMWSKANAAKGAVTILGDSADTFNKRLKQMKDSTGATGKALEKLKTPSSEAKKALNELKNDGIELGAEALKELKPLLDDGKKAIKGITEWIKKLNPEQKQALIHALEIIAVIGPGVTILSKMFNGIGNIVGILPKAIQWIRSLTTATETATAAQTALNVAESSNPIGAVIAAIGALIAIIGILTLTNQDAAGSTYELSEAQQKASEKTEEIANSYKTYQENKEKALSDTKGEFDYYESLLTELDKIVDEHGKVKKGYEDRAKFITTELGNITGEEIKWNEKTIESYDKVRESIEKMLKVREGEATLSSLEPSYQEAKSNIGKKKEYLAEQWNAYQETYKSIYGKGGLLEQYNKADAEAKEAEKAAKNADVGTPAAFNAKQRANRLRKKASELYNKIYVDDGENKSAVSRLKEYKKNYDTLAKEIASYQRTISNYEQLSVAVVKGSTKEIGEALFVTQNDFITAKNGTIATLAEQKDKYLERYEEMEQALRSGASNVTQADVEEARLLYQRALQEYNEYARTHVEETRQSLADRLNAAINNYQDLVKRYKEGDETVTEEMISNAKYTMQSLQNEYDSLPIIAQTATQKTANKIREKGTEFYDAGKSIGKQTTWGLSDGIKDEDVIIQCTTSIGTVFDNIVGTFKNIFGIHSPSKVAMKLGQYIGLGLVSGLDNSSSNVRKSAEKLSGVIKDTLSNNVYDTNFKVSGTYADLLKKVKPLYADALKASNINNVSKNINGHVNLTINAGNLNSRADVERIGKRLAEIIIRQGMEWG